MKIVRTQDKEVAENIQKAIDNNGGYCPCALAKTPETKCMCREFVESQISGWCRCGLYYKEVNL